MSVPSASTATVPLERIIRIAEFRACMRIFDRHVEQAARRNRLTPQRFLLLLQIEGAPESRQSVGIGELAERLQLSPNSVTELVTRAEEAGLVARAPSPDDARAVQLRLTRTGRQRLHGVLVEIEGYRDELRAAFEALSERFELTND